MAGGDMTPGRAHTTAELRRRIVELRDEGLAFRDIAAHPDVQRDVSAVWNHYNKAMRQIPAAAIEEHAKRCALRLDEQLRRIDMERELLEPIAFGHHVQVSNGVVVRPITGRDANGKPTYGDPIEDPAPVMAAIDRLHKLDDQEAKLLGIYPKQAISVTRETSELDATVISLITQAKAAAAERAAKVREQQGK
jgi:hypothetical protein